MSNAMQTAGSTSQPPVLAAAVKAAIEKDNPNKELDTLYTLRYKKGQGSLSVNFMWTADQRDAEKVARAYCDNFRLRFIWVERFCIDITQTPREELEP